MSQVITQEVAAKVLSIVDAGLVSGVGEPKPGHMCVEAAVCYAMGLPHGDDPQCVSRALRSLKIALNDKSWSSNEARAKGLRRLAVAQLGSRDVLDDREFAKRVAKLAITKSVPLALRAAASIQKDPDHKAKLIAAANRCETEGTKDAYAYAAANAAANAAYAAYAAYAYAYAAANAAANAAAYAAASASAYAAYAAADAAYAAADAATDAADAAYAAADATAAAYAAADAAYAAKKKARDKALSEFAEDVVQILIEMKAPGCQWLALTEAA